MQVLTECISPYSGSGNMRTNAIHREHEESKKNALSELRNIKYVLNAGEQGLYYLSLPAGGFYFFYRCLTEFMSANRDTLLQLTHTKHLDLGF